MARRASERRSTPWRPSAARKWARQRGWPVGVCYTTSTAVNQLEMWQRATFDAGRIAVELGWAEDLGLNALRVFLHPLLWRSGPRGFTDRIRRFLAIAERHHLRVLPVLFDSCWDPDPRPGPQLSPRPGVCMSRWVQGPGRETLEDLRQHPLIKEYVQGIVREFKDDDRILGWDVWNEPDHLPDNQTAAEFGARESPRKLEIVGQLLPRVFHWARAEQPIQPLTSGLWNGQWDSVAHLRPVERVQLSESDVVSFHCYGRPSEFERRVSWLESLGRPIWCTEFMARGEGSTFAGILPIARDREVGAWSWGFVAGRTQSYLPWDSWIEPYVNRAPPRWFHDVLHSDGSPYDSSEAELIRTVTGSNGPRLPGGIRREVRGVPPAGMARRS